MGNSVLFRKLTSIFLIIFTLLVSITAYASVPIVNLDGKELSIDVPPIIENDRTLVPMRVIFEALGAEIYWDNDTQTASAIKGNVAVAVQVGNYYANKNNLPVELDVPPKVINGRTLIPLRFVSEAFGCDVKWDEETMTVTITSPDYVQSTKSIVGFWADNAYSGSLVDAVTGYEVGTSYSGQCYVFRDDGTFKYAIAGSGMIITGLCIVEGKYRIEGNKVVYSDCTETTYRNFIVANKEVTPTTMDTEELIYNPKDDTLKLGIDYFHRLNLNK